MISACLAFALTLPQGSDSTLEKIEREIAAVVEKTRGSVVQIVAKSADDGFESNIALPFTRRLTGIVVSEDGYILTDLGPVEDARRIEVTLHDGRRMTAERKGIDRITSLALLRVDASGLSPCEFADPESIRQGNIAVLVSNPAGLKQSCAVGFVSGLQRTVRVSGVRYEDLIQTSAAVQPGDAGGLLANARGLVIGMIHSRYQPSGFESDPAGFLRPVPPEGLDFLPSGGPSVGFATPSSTLKFVSSQLIKQGKVVRGWAGMTVRRIGGSAFIVETAVDGPAEKAGLRAHDVLVEFDGRPVTELSILKRSVAESALPRTVRVRVRRGDAVRDADITLAPEPAP